MCKRFHVPVPESSTAVAMSRVVDGQGLGQGKGQGLGQFDQMFAGMRSSESSSSSSSSSSNNGIPNGDGNDRDDVEGTDALASGDMLDTASRPSMSLFKSIFEPSSLPSSTEEDTIEHDKSKSKDKDKKGGGGTDGNETAGSSELDDADTDADNDSDNEGPRKDKGSDKPAQAAPAAWWLPAKVIKPRTN